MGEMGHECEVCTFVASKEAIHVDPEIVRSLGWKPVFINFFTLLKWSGHSAFYVFKCPECKQPSIDYPHGYIDFGLLYFNCEKCGSVIPLEVGPNRKIYEREEVPVPPLRLRQRKMNVEQELRAAAAARISSIKKPNWLNKIKSFFA